MLIYRATFTDKDGRGPTAEFSVPNGISRSGFWEVAAAAVGHKEIDLLGTMRVTFVCDTDNVFRRDR